MVHEVEAEPYAASALLCTATKRKICPEYKNYSFEKAREEVDDMVAMVKAENEK